MKNFLSHEQVLSYISLHKRYKKDQRKSDRIKAILMLNKGYNYKEISEVLLIDDSTIRRWHVIFTKSGIKTLLEDKSEEDRIYFMDGVHPLHNVQPAFGWIKKGKEQVIKTNTGRQRINVNGAYDIEEHKVIIREDESINAQSTIKLLEQINIK